MSEPVYSIRKRLNLTIIASMIVVLALAAGFLHVRVADQIEAVFDAALLDKARALISLTELDEEGLEFDFAEDGVMSEFEPGESAQYYQLWESDTELLIKSPSLATSDLPQSKVQPGQHHFSDLTLADGRAGRLVAIGFMPRIEEPDEEEDALGDMPVAKPIALILARERASLDHTLWVIGSTIWGGTLVVLLLVALLVWRLVGSGLAPLSKLASQVSDIDESNLGARLQHSGTQSIEIAPIEHQLNYLLERLQSAFEREKRFSANVAHELRTPLSELKTLAEVAEMVPDDPEQVTRFFRDVGEISGQMERLVITLLELARSEAGLLRADPEDIDLARYCDQIWTHAINGQSNSKTLVNHVQPNLVINTDRDKLGMILSNLFVNAVSYSPDNAEIHVSAEIRNQNIVLQVKNAAMDLKPEDIVHMKDRFWRKQRSHDDNGHSGLGLALVHALARVMQLDVQLQLDQQREFRVTISGLQPGG
ncbi:MAG: hypothetical protein HKN50_12980 [Gammaproteobacteria bacterium]|nr:hypothetical protein [Gammaproteobacteria bacterium]